MPGRRFFTNPPRISTGGNSSREVFENVLELPTLPGDLVHHQGARH
jgi:hypothetical protein